MSRSSLVLPIVTIAGGLVPAEAQQPNPMQLGLQSWNRCVDQSFVQQSTVTPDRSLAVETAFQACQTEEEALFALAPSLSPAMSRNYRILMRMKAKQRLVPQ